MEEMKKSDVIEILKILREKDKKDLLTKMRIVFEDLLDEEYIPPKKIKSDAYSDTEGSAEEEEEYYTTEDEHGFLSLA